MRSDVSEEIVNRRFWAKVSLPDTDGCLSWIGARQTNGYGRFADSTKGKTVLAHRYAYELASGEPIPERLVVDHICRNRACVNPQHMEIVTQRENVLRGAGWGVIIRARGVCDRGHQLGGANRRSDNDGCRRCQQDNYRLRYARKMGFSGRNR